MLRYVWEHFFVIWCHHCSVISELGALIPAALCLCLTRRHSTLAVELQNFSGSLFFFFFDCGVFRLQSKPAADHCCCCRRTQLAGFSKPAAISQLPDGFEWLASFAPRSPPHPLVSHTRLKGGRTDHLRGSYNDHAPATSIPGNHKCWIGHSSREEKLALSVL